METIASIRIYKKPMCVIPEPSKPGSASYDEKILGFAVLKNERPVVRVLGDMIMSRGTTLCVAVRKATPIGLLNRLHHGDHSRSQHRPRRIRRRTPLLRYRSPMAQVARRQQRRVPLLGCKVLRVPPSPFHRYRLRQLIVVMLILRLQSGAALTRLPIQELALRSALDHSGQLVR